MNLPEIELDVIGKMSPDVEIPVVFPNAMKMFGQYAVLIHNQIIPKFR